MKITIKQIKKSWKEEFSFQEKVLCLAPILTFLFFLIYIILK